MCMKYVSVELFGKVEVVSLGIACAFLFFDPKSAKMQGKYSTLSALSLQSFLCFRVQVCLSGVYDLWQMYECAYHSEVI